MKWSFWEKGEARRLVDTRMPAGRAGNAAFISNCYNYTKSYTKHDNLYLVLTTMFFGAILASVIYGCRGSPWLIFD